MGKIRNSNFELLRILAIIMIIYIHAFGLISGMGYTELGKMATILANSVCNIGVSCFILISGYFGINFKLKKVIKMELMVVFYSVLMAVLTALVFPNMMTDSFFELLIKSCIPVASRKYWFYSCYICLVFLSPFINEAVVKVEKNLYLKFLLISLILFSIFPTFFYFEITLDNGKGLINMLLLYMIGRWIKLYADYNLSRKKLILIFIILCGTNYLLNIFPVQIGPVRHTFNVDNSITNIMMAVILLYFFKEM